MAESATTVQSPDLRLARNAVGLVFGVNGFAFGCWLSRVPEVRTLLSLSPGQLGAVLLALSVSAITAMSLTGLLVQRYGATRVVGTGVVLMAAGLAVIGIGSSGLGLVAPTVVGLAVLGFGSSTWDVAMNVQAAAVEQRAGRSIMPRFHAAFSLGTVLGAAAGAAVSAAGVSVQTHLVLGALVVLAAAMATLPWLPATHRGPAEGEGASAARRTAVSPLRAWTEPRTLLLGVLVLALALAEGTANDWLAVALVDGYGLAPWMGAAGFALFEVAMTTGRMVGPGFLDRWGRLPVLWSTMALSGAGVVAVVFGGWLPLVALGIVVWGLGTSLGFPVGMSAAADDPARAGGRVSVVATVGYGAFLAGPPLLGYLGDHVGVLAALLVVAVLLVPASVAVPAARTTTGQNRP